MPAGADATLQRFRQEMRGLLHERIGIACVAAAIVYPCYLYQDYRMMPEQWQPMFLLRVSSALFCMLALAINKSAWGSKRPYALSLVVMSALCFAKTFITTLSACGMDTLYFGGHVLLIVGALALMPLSGLQALGMAVAGHLGYSVPMLIWGRCIDPMGFYIQNTLMVTIWLLLVVGCHLNYQARYRAFRLRGRLYAARQRVEDYG